MLLNLIHSSNSSRSLAWKQEDYNNSDCVSTTFNLASNIAESCRTVSSSYGPFKSEAAEQASNLLHSLKKYFLLYF